MLPENASIFDLKSANLTLIAIVLKNPDLDTLKAALTRRLANHPHFFNQDPVVIDLSAIRHHEAPLDIPGLLSLLREYQMTPVAAKGGSDAQMRAFFEAGLTEAPEQTESRIVEPTPAHAPSQAAEPVSPVAPPLALPASLILDRPLRSGQQVYAKNTNLVVLAMVSAGAEVIADGSIHVFAPLRGKAIAGARGWAEARIFTTGLDAELLSIAGVYRTSEQPLPPALHKQAAHIWLDHETLRIDPIAV